MCVCVIWSPSHRGTKLKHTYFHFNFFSAYNKTEKEREWKRERINTLGLSLYLICWLLLNSAVNNCCYQSNFRSINYANISRSKTQLLATFFCCLLGFVERGNELGNATIYNSRRRPQALSLPSSSHSLAFNKIKHFLLNINSCFGRQINE